MSAAQPSENIDSGPDSLRLRDLAGLLLANVALALGPLLVRIADTGPVASAFWRIALALPVLMIFAWRFDGRPSVPRRFWPWLALAGVFFAADLASWHVGILHTKLANATLLGNTASLLYPVYGFIALSRWPNRVQTLALLLAIAGGGLLIGRSYDLSPNNFLGDLLSLGAGIFYTFYLIGIQKARDSLPQWSVLAWSTVASALPLLLAAIALGEQIMPGDWRPLIGLAVLSQIVGQGLLVLSLGRLPPLIIGLAFLTQPFIAALAGWIVYREALGLADWVGGALIAVALILVRQRDQGPSVTSQTSGGAP